MVSPKVAGDPWLRCFHPAPQRPLRLICLPHAGGSASSYFAFSAGIDEVAEVRLVQYPGRQDRWQEKPIADLVELAGPIADAISSQISGPFAIFGHSMGSAVAFEVTRKLEQRGTPPVRLFASGGRSPSLERSEGIHLLDDAGVIGEMKRLGGTDPRLLDDPEILELVLPAVRADYTAIETYRAASDATISTPVTTMVGDADPRTTIKEAAGWESHTTGEFELRVFPGGHFFVFDRLPDVARTITERLRSH